MKIKKSIIEDNLELILLIGGAAVAIILVIAIGMSITSSGEEEGTTSKETIWVDGTEVDKDTFDKKVQTEVVKETTKPAWITMLKYLLVVGIVVLIMVLLLLVIDQ